MSTLKIIRGSFLLFLFIVASIFCYSDLYAQNPSLEVLTYNIRYSNNGDAPNTWQQRKDKVFSVIRDAAPDVFGLQEALLEQVEDLQKAFPDFTRVGVGRDDGKVAGEFSPIFFNTARFSLIHSGTFWLSQTPTVPGSRGWDAACNRVVTFAKLSENSSGKQIFVFCTHFDHIGEEARRNSAFYLLKVVDSLSEGKPAIVMGDFNAIPSSEPFLIITDKTNPLHLVDSRNLCEKVRGPEYTFTGFNVAGTEEKRIDYIFLKGIEKVSSFSVNDENNGEFYPSDHLPVSAVLEY